MLCMSDPPNITAWLWWVWICNDQHAPTHLYREKTKNVCFFSYSDFSCITLHTLFLQRNMTISNRNFQSVFRGPQHAIWRVQMYIYIFETFSCSLVKITINSDAVKNNFQCTCIFASTTSPKSNKIFRMCFWGPQTAYLTIYSHTLYISYFPVGSKNNAN